MALTLASTTVALLARIGDDEPTEIGTIELETDLAFDRETGIAAIKSAPLVTQLASAFREVAARLDEGTD